MPESPSLPAPKNTGQRIKAEAVSRLRKANFGRSKGYILDPVSLQITGEVNLTFEQMRTLAMAIGAPIITA